MVAELFPKIIRREGDDVESKGLISELSGIPHFIITRTLPTPCFFFELLSSLLNACGLRQ